MLKLLRTLPKVLKYLPSDKAADARSFMMSFQVCETLDATHTLIPVRSEGGHARRRRACRASRVRTTQTSQTPRPDSCLLYDRCDRFA